MSEDDDLLLFFCWFERNETHTEPHGRKSRTISHTRPTTRLVKEYNMLSHMISQEMGAGRRRLTRTVFKIIQCFIGMGFFNFLYRFVGGLKIFTQWEWVSNGKHLFCTSSLSSSKREEWSRDCRRVRGSQVCWRMLLGFGLAVRGEKSSFWEVSGVAS